MDLFHLFRRNCDYCLNIRAVSNVHYMSPCPRCNKWGWRWHLCPKCHGRQIDDSLLGISECQHCQGTGRNPRYRREFALALKCSTCLGKKQVRYALIDEIGDCPDCCKIPVTLEYPNRDWGSDLECNPYGSSDSSGSSSSSDSDSD